MELGICKGQKKVTFPPFPSLTRQSFIVLVREAAELSSSPSPDYTAAPLESDLFEWHFTLRGPPNSPYAEGIYHGRIVLPPSYPLRPPSFRFVTPSGRFEANREICLSISGHHEETWQPAWGVRTALVALRSFMETDPRGQLGGLDTSDPVRRQLAAQSRSFRCGICGPHTNADIIAQCEEAARSAEAAQSAGAGDSGPAEVQVPSELKMGWRDEMEKYTATAAALRQEHSGAGDAAGQEGGSGGPGTARLGAPTPDAESSQLAEGFVQTAPVPHSAAVPPRPAPAPLEALQPVAAGPAWIDQLIMVVGVLLVALVLKVFLST